MTREEWLGKMFTMITEVFEENGYKLPTTRISCGWPTRKAIGVKTRTLGQCFAPKCSKDKTTEIFISPYIAEGLEAADVLAHEMIHAAVGVEEGHKGKFKDCANDIGMVGKMTQARAGDDLKDRLASFCAEVGKYPHAKLDVEKQIKKDGTRMIKVMCPRCLYTVRTSQKWIDLGLPTCCCGMEMKVYE